MANAARQILAIHPQFISAWPLLLCADSSLELPLGHTFFSFGFFFDQNSLLQVLQEYYPMSHFIGVAAPATAVISSSSSGCSGIVYTRLNGQCHNAPAVETVIANVCGTNTACLVSATKATETPRRTPQNTATEEKP